MPIGFVQSALASYVSSTGYKLYNDNGTGQDILGSLGELYDDYVTVSNKTITGQLANLAFLANSPYIYQDNSGQIVVSKVAADIFQDFSGWIQTKYNVPVGSETPTTVLTSASGDIWSNGYGISALKFSFSTSLVAYGATRYFDLDHVLGYYNSKPVYLYCNNIAGAHAFLTYYQTSNQLFFASTSGNLDCGYMAYDGSSFEVRGAPPAFSSTWVNTTVPSFMDLSSVPLSSVQPSGVVDLEQSSGGAVGLGVTLAQAVADVVGQAKDDDAVVIGVGAGVGATAQDIADMVAQGVKAQTLNPSVSITAEAVIDTPVQPYPDIEGLGLPQLGAALVERFPFCIPWDFVDTLRLFSADPQPINIKVDLIPQRIKTAAGITSDTSFDIDLSGQQYAKIGVFCRWGSLIAFCFGLFLLTKRLVWTA